MASPGLTKLLFEIASDERLGILESLERAPAKHSAIVRARSMTGSETTRHLNRLAGAGLVRRNADGEYSPTPFADALLAMLPFLEFLAEHREFLLHHSVACLPPEFQPRLGELRHAQFIEGTYPVVALQEEALRGAHRRIWVFTEQRFEQALPILREKARAGIDVRVVRSRRFLDEEKRSGRDVPRNFEIRAFPEVSFFLAVLDDQGGLCLPTNEGKVDMATMIRVTDPLGCRWSEELFLRHWDTARIWHAPPREPAASASRLPKLRGRAAGIGGVGPVPRRDRSHPDAKPR